MQLKVCSKTGSRDVIEISRTADGWHISNVECCGDCDKEGYPYLYQALEYRGVHYRANLGTCLEALWDASDENEGGDAWIQERLNQISSMINESNISFSHLKLK